MRELLQSPPKRKRRRVTTKEDEFNRNARARMDSLDRKCRWMMLTDFNNARWKVIMEAIYPEGLEEDSPDYHHARQKILDNFRNYKHKTLKAMEVSIFEN